MAAQQVRRRPGPVQCRLTRRSRVRRSTRSGPTMKQMLAVTALLLAAGWGTCRRGETASPERTNPVALPTGFAEASRAAGSSTTAGALTAARPAGRIGAASSNTVPRPSAGRATEVEVLVVMLRTGAWTSPASSSPRSLVSAQRPRCTRARRTEAKSEWMIASPASRPATRVCWRRSGPRTSWSRRPSRGCRTRRRSPAIAVD